MKPTTENALITGRRAQRRAYEYRHIVTFAETNVVGNVYFSHIVAWQGRCRELFLKEHAPDVLDALTQGLSLVTLNVQCDYLAELRAFDEIILRMRLLRQVQNRLLLKFDYVRVNQTGEEIVARGSQEIASMVQTPNGLSPTPIPDSLAKALRPFVADISHSTDDAR